MHTESTVEDILKTVQKFRILCVGRSGVGKSSLINRVFGIDEAQISEFKPGEADIEQEFVSEQNGSFVLHDSKGFEPGDNSAFNTVNEFILRRCDREELKDRIHAIWLCTETPTAGSRVFESGDEKLVQLAHKRAIPLVIVFTQYDMLVETKIMQLKRRDNKVTPEAAKRQGEAEAVKALQVCVESLERSMKKLGTTMPPFAEVSIDPGYEDNLSNLSLITRIVVQDRLKNDAWLMWAIAQRVSLPVKIDACIDKGVSYYYRALSGTVPGVGKTLLRECIAHVHKDIVDCWNLRNGDQILKGADFKQLMLYLVQDVQDESSSAAPPDLDRISQFVTLVTAASAPVAPPIAILGLSYFFVKWVSDAVLDNIPSVERLIMAYTIDLILVLKSLFHFTLKPDLAGSANWEVVKEAFEAYERSHDVQQNHNSCRSALQQNNRSLDRDGFSAKMRELLGEVPQLWNRGGFRQIDKS